MNIDSWAIVCKKTTTTVFQIFKIFLPKKCKKKTILIFYINISEDFWTCITYVAQNLWKRYTFPEIVFFVSFKQHIFAGKMRRVENCNTFFSILHMWSIFVVYQPNHKKNCLRYGPLNTITFVTTLSNLLFLQARLQTINEKACIGLRLHRPQTLPCRLS